MNAPNPSGASADALVDLQETLYASRQPTRRYLHLARRDWITAQIQRLAATTQAATAIEIGPGSGVYLPHLLNAFQQVTATDIEDAYLAHARNQFADEPRLTLRADDITASQLPAGSFDLVLCSEVIEHIPADRAQDAIRGMARLLRPGGVLVLSTPQPRSPLEICCKAALKRPLIWLARAVYREPVLPTGHINLMPIGRVQAFLRDAGLVEEDTHCSGVYLPLLAELLPGPALSLARWLEPRLLRGPGRGLLWTQYHSYRQPPASATSQAVPPATSPD